MRYGIESPVCPLQIDQQHRRSGGAASNAVAIAAFTLLLGGCSSREPGAHIVSIRGFQYAPSALTVAVGDTVTWVNEDLVPHTVTSSEQGFDSGGIETSQSWQFVAADTGRFRYICTFHPAMRATVVVGGH